MDGWQLLMIENDKNFSNLILDAIASPVFLLKKWIIPDLFFGFLLTGKSKNANIFSGGWSYR